MLEFKIDEFITLKLENGKTNIYVEEKLFKQCKFLLLHIPVKNIDELDEMETVDEVAGRLNQSLEHEGNNLENISPEVEFWAHSSNLQTWVENNYNTKLLHRNLAFSLLKKLSDSGVRRARQVFKEEIIKRFESGFLPVVQYLILQGYLNYLNEEELNVLFENYDLPLFNLLYKEIRATNGNQLYKLIRLFNKLSSFYPKIFESVAIFLKKKKKENVISEKVVEIFKESYVENKNKFISIEMQKFYLNILSHYKDPLITINFLEILIKTGLSELKKSKKIIEKNIKIPHSKKIILQSGKLAIMIRINLNNASKNYPRLIFKHIEPYYNRIIQQYMFSDNIEIFLINLSDFFELFWILTIIIPRRVEGWIERYLEKYGGSYENAFNKCYKHVSDQEVTIQNKDNHLNIKTSSYINTEEKDLLEFFNANNTL